MPLDPVTGSFITTGANLLGGLIGQGAQHRRNVKLWKMQAEYNSPEQQMARLKAAGLNPHLVYGQGASGASGSMSTAPDSAKIDVGNVGSDFSNNYFAMQQLKLTETKQQAEINQMEINNALTIARTESQLLGNKFDSESFKSRIDELQLKNENLTSSTALNKSSKAVNVQRVTNMISENKNLGATFDKIVADTNVSRGQLKIQSASLLKTAEEIKNLTSQRKYTEAQTALQTELLRWYKMGISPNSSPVEKLIYEILSETGLRQGVINLLKDSFNPLKPKTTVGKGLKQMGDEIGKSMLHGRKMR